MNWRNKARLAKAISLLPDGISSSAYYFMQRRFGGLRSASPDDHLQGAVTIVESIRRHGRELRGGETFLELGTGRSLALPIALWLCGASRIITVDRNPYLKSELVFEELSYSRNQQETLKRVFSPYNQERLFNERFESLTKFKGGLTDLLSLLNVCYLAPVDAAHLDLPSESVDFHFSFGVIEHVDSRLLDGIFFESRRVLKHDGLAVHYATLADLFSGIDHSISPVNFLQFSQEEWDSIAGNRYMYHNRMRVDDLRGLFERTGFRILELRAKVHPESLRLIVSGEMPLDARFQRKSPEINASQHVWLCAAPALYSVRSLS